MKKIIIFLTIIININLFAVPVSTPYTPVTPAKKVSAITATINYIDDTCDNMIVTQIAPLSENNFNAIQTDFNLLSGNCSGILTKNISFPQFIGNTEKPTNEQIKQALTTGNYITTDGSKVVRFLIPDNNFNTVSSLGNTDILMYYYYYNNLFNNNANTTNYLITNVQININ